MKPGAELCGGKGASVDCEPITGRFIAANRRPPGRARDADIRGAPRAD